jgi:ribonuclease Z
MIRITFLGTSASRPTVGRGVSAIAVQREGELMLWDCGEGTQRQMMRYGTGFALGAVFVTHLHADHFLGLIGLTRTLSLQDRTEPLTVYGPPGSEPVLTAAISLGQNRFSYPIQVQELEPWQRVRRDGYDVIAFQVRHGLPAVGYVLAEHDRPGRFDVERARALGVPEGPLFGRLHRGESVEVDGRTVEPGQVVGPPRPGRRIVYTGDTRPQKATVEVAHRAQLLIHDATFAHEEAERARATQHSTAHEAGELARRAEVERLILTHVSARYSANPAPLEQEAARAFPGARVAHDGLTLEIGYDQGDEKA